MTKKVLVTGANGQLGQTIKELYEDNNVDLDFVFLSKDQLDITKEDILKAFFSKNSIGYCINCAAYTNVEQAEKTPEIAYTINAEGVKKLASVCYKNNTVLIHVSTDYVFDGEKHTPYIVGDQTNPINEYGKSKLQGEQYIQKILDSYFIVRTSWLYSKKYGNNFYRTIVKKAKTEKELLITTEQKGAPTNTENLAKYIVNLIQERNEIYGIFHFCDKKVMTWFSFAEQILKSTRLYNNVTLIKVKNYRTFAKRPKNSVIN